MIVTFEINRFSSLVNSSELADDEGPIIRVGSKIDGALLLLLSNLESKLCIILYLIIIL